MRDYTAESPGTYLGNKEEEDENLAQPDQPFCNFRASRSGDRRFLCS